MSYNDESDNTAAESTVSKVTLLARKLARVVLSVVESQNTIINRPRLQKMAKEIAEKEEYGTVRFNEIFQEMNAILNDVYGYELKTLPPRVANPAGDQPDSSSTKTQRYILLDNNASIDQLNDLILAQNESIYVQTIQNGEYIGDRLAFESTNTIDNKLSVDQDQTFKGLLSVILCTVLFSKNNILQQELFEHLQKFGVPTDGSPIPIINIPILELLKTLDKLEYLSRHQEHTDLDLETVTYRIGRRTQAEFPLDSLVLLIRNVMGITEQQAPNLREDIRKNVADAYPSSNNSSALS